MESAGGENAAARVSTITRIKEEPFEDDGYSHLSAPVGVFCDAILYIPVKTIFLPRQARDKHRENSS